CTRAHRVERNSSRLSNMWCAGLASHGHRRFSMAGDTGGCHCGKGAFALESDATTQGMACNCSLCAKRGAILHFVPAAAFALKTPRAALSTYRFNKRVIAHHFCATCGVAAFGEGVGPGGNAMAAINLRCV